MSPLRQLPLVALIACSSPPAEAPPRAPTATRMGVHGMVLFGGERLYLSHIPMFHPPHDAQLVLEVRASGDGLPSSFSDQLYTIEPERFGLDSLRDGTRTRFAATVYRGNFEQGGVAIARAVGFEVVRVVLDRPLVGDVAAAAPEYLALGRRDHLALIRILGGAPGFDQILAARLDGDGPTDDALARGVRVALPAAGDGPAARVGPGGAAGTVDGQPVSVTVTAELSCLVGPDFTESCPPPRRASPTR